MSVLLDIDQLRTFIAIAETGSFTKASEVVHKTQSAVSMQMKRLEERVGKPIFARDGRASRLTDEGERLLDYARRIVKLNIEAMASLASAELSGRVRLGVPDDYADRYLPEIMARFSATHPNVELTVVCDPSTDLIDRIDTGDLDLAIITDCEMAHRETEIIRREQLLWVGSMRHSSHLDDPVPLALAGRAATGGRRRSPICRQRGGPSASSTPRRTAPPSRRLCSRVWPYPCCRNRACARACVCSAPRMVFPRWHPAASGCCATGTMCRCLPMRSPSTSCRASTTFPTRRSRRSDGRLRRPRTAPQYAQASKIGSTERFHSVS